MYSIIPCAVLPAYLKEYGALVEFKRNYSAVKPGKFLEISLPPKIPPNA